MKKISLLLSPFLIFSCVTMMAINDYTTVIPLGKGRFEVSAGGNAFHSYGRVKDFALYRAAMVTLESGKEYFIILRTSSGTNSGIANIGFGGESNYISYSKQNISLIILPTDDPEGILAQGIIDELQ